MYGKVFPFIMTNIKYKSAGGRCDLGRKIKHSWEVLWARADFKRKSAIKHTYHNRLLQSSSFWPACCQKF